MWLMPTEAAHVAPSDRSGFREILKRVATPLVRWLPIVLVIGGRHYLADLFEPAHSSALVVAMVLLLPEVLPRLSDDPGFAAWVFVHRSRVIAFLLFVSLTFATILFHYYKVWEADTFTSVPVMTFLVLGALVGGFIRAVFTGYLKQVIRGVSTEAVQATLLLLVAVYLFLFPISEEHRIFAAPYLAGLAGGFVVHFLLRGHEQRSAYSHRMSQNIQARLRGSSGPEVQERESEAVKLYARQRWVDLRSLMKANEDTMSTRLAIVKASMERFLGHYEKALETVDRALDRYSKSPMRDSALYTSLQLLRALCLGELGAEPKEIFGALGAALKENPRCVLSNVTWALRTAEQPDASPRQLLQASARIRRAMSRAGRDEPGVWGATVGMTVPVTSTFLVDAVGYVAMRNGDMVLSKSLFEHCINVDQKFASPYLHLGEWYKTGCLRASSKGRNRYKRVAHLCFAIAIELEGRRDSLIKRRAQTLLAELG